MWRIVELEVVQILIGGIVFLVISAAIIFSAGLIALALFGMRVYIDSL